MKTTFWMRACAVNVSAHISSAFQMRIKIFYSKILYSLFERTNFQYDWKTELFTVLFSSLSFFSHFHLISMFFTFTLKNQTDTTVCIVYSVRKYSTYLMGNHNENRRKKKIKYHRMKRVNEGGDATNSI